MQATRMSIPMGCLRTFEFARGGNAFFLGMGRGAEDMVSSVDVSWTSQASALESTLKFYSYVVIGGWDPILDEKKTPEKGVKERRGGRQPICLSQE